MALTSDRREVGQLSAPFNPSLTCCGQFIVFPWPLRIKTLKKGLDTKLQIVHLLFTFPRNGDGLRQRPTLNHCRYLLVPLDSRSLGRSKRGEVEEKKDGWRKTIRINTRDLGPTHGTFCAPCPPTGVGVEAFFNNQFCVCYKN